MCGIFGKAVVAYDHARHAPLADVITLDFMSAKELRAALGRAITAAEFEEAEARGKD